MITSCQDMIDLIAQWGFVPLFRNDIPGFSVEELTSPELWFTEGVDGPWEWKGPAIRGAACAYGKFFSGKAGFISRDWYPDFANYRRDGYDFDARYEDGLAAYADKLVFDLLSGEDALLSKTLKKLGGFSKDGRRGFDTTITRLQMQGYVTTVDFVYAKDRFGRPYGWGVAQYAVPERHFGEEFCAHVYARTPEESKRRIIAHLSALFPKAGEREILRIVG